jgi:hypothetical protein
MIAIDLRNEKMIQKSISLAQKAGLYGESPASDVILATDQLLADNRVLRLRC